MKVLIVNQKEGKSPEKLHFIADIMRDMGHDVTYLYVGDTFQSDKVLGMAFDTVIADEMVYDETETD